MKLKKIYHCIVLVISLLLLVIGFDSCQNQSRETKKPNVLFIFCDDLNDSVEGMGGHPQAKTPNLTRLAREGIRFTNAHSADPICGPSRASFLTGVYPHNSGLYGHNQNQNAWHNNPVLKNCKPIFEHFADNGYLIFGAGKLFHNNHNTKALFNRPDSSGEFGPGMEYGPFAWTGIRSDNIYNDLPAHPDIPRKFGDWGFSSFASLDNVPVIAPDTTKNLPGYSGWYLADYPDGKPYRYVNENDRDPLPDERTSDYAIEKLQQDHEKPFFLAVGIIRPHSPWHAPKEYFDMFPLDKVEPPPYLENDLDDCAEELWYQPNGEKEHRFLRLLDSYDGDEGWRRFIQGYLACVAFADAQIGQIMDALDDSKYATNTIVVFTSDHGYHMGEKNQLFKRTVWEESTRVPMIFRLPDKENAGLECNHPVGLIDLYPTLIDLCRISDYTMRNDNGHPLDGHSLRPFLYDPVKGYWDGPSVALSCIEAGVPVALNKPGKIEDQQFTIRSRDWRYVLTRTGAEELYDHRNDPHEWHNLASDPRFSDIKEELKTELLRMTGRGISHSFPFDLPPHIKQITTFGQRADWSHDGKKILFIEKTFGDVYEVTVETGEIRPMTHHYYHEGYVRALYLSNGDILLSGARHFDAKDPVPSRKENAELWILKKDFQEAPVALGEICYEGPAVSRINLKIAWSVRGDQPDAVFYRADLSYDEGIPKIINKKEILTKEQLPPFLDIETQNFRPPDEKEIIFSGYGEEYRNCEVMGLVIETGEIKNYSQKEKEYDEPEGIFPDGNLILVECDRHNKKGAGQIDIYKLKLDGSADAERLTYFSDFQGYKSSNPVVSDDGRYMAFQVARKGDWAGVGRGILIFDLNAVNK